MESSCVWSPLAPGKCWTRAAERFGDWPRQVCLQSFSQSSSGTVSVSSRTGETWDGSRLKPCGKSLSQEPWAQHQLFTPIPTACLTPQRSALEKSVSSDPDRPRWWPSGTPRSSWVPCESHPKVFFKPCVHKLVVTITSLVVFTSFHALCAVWARIPAWSISEGT